ncbi:MAG: winged helix-turn-helix transcriptional regulator [Gemmatimonadales bacterium]
MSLAFCKLSSGMGAHRDRSRCPIAYSLDVVGDRWTLLVLRDLAFKNRRYFQDFLGASERISSNILAERLRRLERAGLIEGHADPEDGRRIRYYLTDDGLDLIPVLIEMTIWGSRRHPDPSVPVERAEQMSADREGTVRSYRERLRAEREAGRSR